jgi:hypothetical protein
MPRPVFYMIRMLDKDFAAVRSDWLTDHLVTSQVSACCLAAFAGPGASRANSGAIFLRCSARKRGSRRVCSSQAAWKAVLRQQPPIRLTGWAGISALSCHLCRPSAPFAECGYRGPASRMKCGSSTRGACLASEFPKLFVVTRLTHSEMRRREDRWRLIFTPRCEGGSTGRDASSSSSRRSTSSKASSSLSRTFLMRL